MAPNATGRTPRGKKKEPDFSDVGNKGRKTGVTLKDTGIRDENGMEPMNGIFSSPEKSPAKRNGFAHNVTNTEDETMDIGQSTIPEPTEVLLTQKRHGRTLLPPPRSRSPIKTNLNSAPRRSLGPMSSPSRAPNDHSSLRAKSHPPNRMLNFDVDVPVPTVESSPQKAKLKRTKKPVSIGKGKKRAFDLSMEDESEEEEGISSVLNGAEITTGSAYDDTILFGNGDESLQIPQGDDEQQSAEDDHALQETEEIPNEVVEPEPTPIKKRGRPPKANLKDKSPLSLPAEKSAKGPVQSSRRPAGRPAKKHKAGIGKGKVAEVEPEPSQLEQQASEIIHVTPPPIDKGKRIKAPLAHRDTNPKMKAIKRDNSEAPSVKRSMPPPPLNGRPQGRSLQILRSETPADDSGARMTRSGRTSVKPMAFWRNERIIYGEGKKEGQLLTLPGITEVIRTDEVEIPRPKRPAYRRARPRERHQLEDLVEEEDEEREDWETETGIVRAQVMQWDSMNGRGNEWETEETEIAYASEAIEMRNISGAEFRFAKTLTLPFFGSGIVDLPPGGAKRVKNSRKMQMVFFVFYGRVTVDIGTPTQSFSIGKGGMWQVPRGNFYSISNNSETAHSRIFFAQGCEVFAHAEPSVDESGHN